MKYYVVFLSVQIVFSLIYGKNQQFVNTSFCESKLCDKNKKREFEKCLKEKFLIGESFWKLKKYLESKGFGYSENRKDTRNQIFYFLWSSNDFSNYKIAVTGSYSSAYKIVDLQVR